ncbi:peptidase A4 family-domain-containing protein [Boletus edulis]|uniref:Peptidase A4 family-domain-containing protein n=1 Tax=Boletus edulis BED1 TaxID=1328754 RepID=A0AAD4BNI5_BOLED|nr:peptidase A4 family-domain-containing protein [Boletus edulis]KAF8435718.1 peptidase A4 family-domain-containing protein [Boletus edulis BED1]
MALSIPVFAMRFNFTLISAFSFASAVLADRSLEHRSESSQLNIVEKRTNATLDSRDVMYENWAGATVNQTVPTFVTVTGTFEVPQILGPAGSGVGIWVGMDIGSVQPECALFSAGVMYQMYAPSFGPSYKAVAQWLPDLEPQEFTDIKVSPGDLITVTVTVASDQTTGNATVENQVTAQTLEFHNQVALCQLSAGWIVSKVGVSTLANFDVVSFRQPLALGDHQNFFRPTGDVIFEIENVTATYADENVVAIWHYV